MARRFDKQHEAALRRLGERERRRRSSLSPEESLRRRRLGDLRTIFEDRYSGHVLPDDDAGRGDLREILAVIALGPKPEPKMREETRIRAPWLKSKDADRMIRGILDQPRALLKAKADTLGARLRLTYADRQRLNISTVGSYDVDKETRTELRKQRDRERKRRARHAKGAKARIEYEAQSLSRLQPWQAEGISRRTWERRRKRNETSPSAVAVASPAH